MKKVICDVCRKDADNHYEFSLDDKIHHPRFPSPMTFEMCEGCALDFLDELSLKINKYWATRPKKYDQKRIQNNNPAKPGQY